MMEILGMEFMRNALLAGLLASLACGVIGTIVVVNRQVFMAGGVAHTAYGGVGLAFFLGLPVLPCAVAFTVLAALAMAMASFGRAERSDGGGDHVGRRHGPGHHPHGPHPGYNVDLMSYFSAAPGRPRGHPFMAVLDASSWPVLFWYKDFLALSFDMEFARSTGVPVRLLYALMQVLTAVTVIMVIQVAGLILVIALLTIPPMLAELFTNSLWKMMVLAAMASLVFCLTGLAVSYHFDISSGASIIAMATAGYVLARGARALRRPA
jgi:zinc transport system permease protein